MDFFTLPAATEDSLSLITTFQIPYHALPFRKQSGGEDGEFYSTADLTIELFRGTEKDLRDPDEVDITGRQSVGRAAWSDTATAAGYEETQSRFQVMEGVLSVDLAPGIYVYIMQMTRGENADEQTSRARAFRLRPYDRQEHGDILFGSPPESDTGTRPLSFPLLNIGNHVPYASNYRTLVHLPGHQEGDRYDLRLDRITISDEDTTFKSTQYETVLESASIRTGLRPILDREGIALGFEEGDHDFAFLNIPNNRFPSDFYRMTVIRSRTGDIVAERVFRSLWRDMPASLLNLETAIDMLRFIADDSTIRNIRKGTIQERERKLREFWEERDPTPETEYNELMAEYYRRIDYAYEEFSSRETPGYETDQGRIYIRYGEPQNIERTYPSGEPTREIWIYESRQFVFRATSGFGEFVLVDS